MPSPSADRLLASDLDGTLVSVNTFPLFGRWLGRWLLSHHHYLAVARLVLVTAGRRLRLTGHHDLKLLVCRLGAQVPATELRAWADGILDTYGNPEPIALVRGWRGPTILTTAAPEVYATHLAEALGIERTHASTIREGTLLNNEMWGKLARLRSEGISHLAVFLTDDLVADGPLAAVADLAYLVGRDGRLAALPAAESDTAAPSDITKEPTA